jgi:hypothetical protein
MTAISGHKCIGSWTNSGPLGCLEKMFLASYQWGSTRFFLTWKASVTPQGRLLFRLSLSMHRTEGIESGLWLGTPTSTNSKRSESHGKGRTMNPGEFVLWHTPSQQEPGVRVERLVTKDGEPARRGERAYDKETGRLAQVGLIQQVRMWPTPTTQEAEHPNAELTKTGRRKTKDKNTSHSLGLADAARTWPTPQARDHRIGTPERYKGDQSQKGRRSNLNGAAALFPTPTVPLGGGERSAERAGTGNLHYMARKGRLPTPDAGAAKGRGEASAAQRHRLGGSLNADWVEWLMGFPVGWTNLTESRE